MTFPQLTGNKTRGDPRSPTPTEYYFHHNTSVSLLTCRSRTQLLRPSVPGSIPEAPPTSTAKDSYSHVNQGSESDCLWMCVCVCVSVLVCVCVSTVKKENYHFRCTEGKSHRLSNPKVSATVLQHRHDKVRGEAALDCCRGQHNTIQSPCPWHICGFLSSGLAAWSSWARTTDSSSSRSIHPTLLAQDEDNSKINPLSRASSEEGEGRDW